MSEYINRGTAFDAVTDLAGKASTRSAYEAVWKSARALKKIPAADVAPVVHGRWEQVKEWATKAKYRCSVCGREIMSAVKVNIEKYPYCHCGAKMDGGGDNG
jgi:hypothetical protein